MRFKRCLAVLLIVIFMGMAIETALADSSYNMPYYIGVDITNQIVTIYKTEDDSIVRQMLCSTGKNNATPLGSFYLRSARRKGERMEWYYISAYRCWVKYPSRIVGNILFHSVPYTGKSDSKVDTAVLATFGQPTSHGCIRLMPDDSRFIAENCAIGTFVKIYKSETPDTDLRDMLTVASYTGENGMSYDEFLGRATVEGDLGYQSEGQEVSNLQARLKDLGYYDGEISGMYNSATVLAVKKVQSNLGLDENGITTPKMQEVLFSDFAPVYTNGTIEEGATGPVVDKLQNALKDLALYSGPIDGIYDVEVKEAVMDFQRANNYKETGIATGEIQQAVYFQQNQLYDTFGTLEDIAVEIKTEEIEFGTVDAPTKIIIREKSSTSSKEKGKVKNGETVMILEKGEKWSKITTGKVTGYMKNRFLNFYTQENDVLVYSVEGTEKTYSMGYTLEQYTAGETSFAESFSEYYASSQFKQTDISKVRYITVNASGGAKLYSEADSESEILATLEEGTQLRALSDTDGWTLVCYGQQLGYLDNSQVEIWEGPAIADEEEDISGDEEDPEDVDDDPIYALIVTDNKKGIVDVYDAGSADAEVIGQLKAGMQVQVIELSEADEWVLIDYKGNRGYVLDDNLQFTVTDEENSEN